MISKRAKELIISNLKENCSGCSESDTGMLGCKHKDCEVYQSIEIAIQAVMESPSKGSWVKTEENPIPKQMGFKCSRCGRMVYLSSRIKNVPKALLTQYPYCHCGANMK